jgi:ABC-type phosphate transport system substrate-binding protein
MTLLRTSLLLATTWLAAGAVSAQGTYKLIVHPSNPASTLPRSDVARMFLKKVTTWPDGRPVAVIDQERTSEVRKVFSRDVHQRDADAVANYWQTAVFSGRDVPPPIGRTDDEVLAFVRANPGAIGYVSGGADTTGVKVVTVK